MSQWDGLVQQAAQKYNVDPKLLASVIQTESNGNPNAYNSSTQAAGLTQIIPATAKSLGVDPTDPAQAIEGAAKLLDQNLTRYGNAQQAILAYHGGTDPTNWGPKTQDYLAKVTANYGGSPVATQSATQAAPADDFSAFTQRFGVTPGQSGKSATSAPPEDFSAFTQRFGVTPGQSPSAAKAQPDTVIGQQQPTGGQAMTVANTQPGAAPAAPDQPGLAGQAWNALGKLGDIGIGNVNAAGRGIHDVLDTGAEWLAKGLDKSGATDALKSLGIDSGTYEQQVAADKAARDQYEASTTGGIQQGASRLIGNMAGVAIPIAGAEAGLAKGGTMLADALGNPAALAKAGDFVAGKGGVLSKATYGALQGAGAGALLSGGQPDADPLESIGIGALLGGAAPVAGSAIRGAINTVKGIAAPFSAEGRDALARQMIQGDAAKVAPKFATQAADDAAPPAAASTGPAPDLTAPSDPATGALSRFAMNGPTKGDFTEYVPGSTPTLAQATGNAGLAQLERTMSPRDINSFTARQESNNAARQSYLEQIRGTPETIQAAQEVREQQAIPLLQQAFAGAGKADSQPVMNAIKGILSGPDGQRDVVQAALNPIIKKLQIGQQFQRDPLIPGSKVPVGVNGNGLEYDVGQLYGIRKSINDQLERVAGKDNSVSQLASSDLLKIKSALDDTIEKAAPGFKDYLSQYSELSKPINAMNYLQKADLTDATSANMTLNKTKQLMMRINKDRAAPGANDAKSISDDQMQMLANLHKDLQRANNSAKGMAIKSDTAANLQAGKLVDSLLIPGSGTVGQVSSASLGGLLGHALAGPAGAVPGSIIAQQAGQRFNQAVASKAPEVEARLIDYLLNSRGEEALKAAASPTPAIDALFRRAPVAAPAVSSPAGQNNR